MKTMKLLEENRGENLHKLGLSKDFLIKESQNMTNWTSSQLKSFASHRRMKRQFTGFGRQIGKTHIKQRSCMWNT